MLPFYSNEDGTYVPSTSTRGPWDDRFQHGGPPSALLLRVMFEAMPSGFAVARLTTEFSRPVPIEPLTVDVSAPAGGRRAKRVQAHLRAGDTVVLEATALFLAENDAIDHPTITRPGTIEAPWPAPESLEPFEFPFFRSEVAYHRAVEVRPVDAPWGTTPFRCWARPRVELVADTPTRPEEAVVVLADAESGMGPPLDPDVYSYANPDLTVYFGRRPQPGWTGFEIRSRADGAGIGLAESRIRDAEGVFGQCAQALVIAER
ncbi:MAG: thioesterase family protein [Deltaproteobacteria bacterium]|jgi:hypothetical protein